MRLSLLLLICALSTACGTTLKATQTGADGLYETDTKVGADAILVSAEVPLADYKSMFFAKVDVEGNDTYAEFYRASVDNIGFFDRVLLREDLEELILSQGLADNVPSVSDRIGLYHASKHLGNFLVGELSTLHKGGYNYEADLKIFDPTDAKTLFHVHHKAFNWDGLDKPLFRPMFNAMIDWINRNK